MNIRPNQFFNPVDCPYHVEGFFEEYIDVSTERKQCLGWRKLDVEEAPRALGSDGAIERTLTAPITLTHGAKQVLVKASPQRPVHVKCMVQVLCGKQKEKQCN
jgi:hypothetical protein